MRNCIRAIACLTAAWLGTPLAFAQVTDDVVKIGVLADMSGLYSDLPARVAFTRTTDGEDCPVNAVWQPDEMMALARDAGFEPEFLGAAISLWELHVLPRRHIACLSQSLVPESRAFLMNLRLDSQGIPWYGRHRAGVDGCYRLRRRR